VTSDQWLTWVDDYAQRLVLAGRERPGIGPRGFIDRIVIPPGDALLQGVGNLGEMLVAVGAPREAAVVGWQKRRYSSA